MPDGYDKSFWNGGTYMVKEQDTDPAGGKKVIEVTQNYTRNQSDAYRTD